MNNKSPVDLTVDNSSPTHPWRRAAYSIVQLQKIVPISRSGIYREARAGRLKLSKLAGRTIVTDGDLMVWLASCDEAETSGGGDA